jgi:hypothetical protein
VLVKVPFQELLGEVEEANKKKMKGAGRATPKRKKDFGSTQPAKRPK